MSAEAKYPSPKQILIKIYRIISSETCTAFPPNVKYEDIHIDVVQALQAQMRDTRSRLRTINKASEELWEPILGWGVHDWANKAEYALYRELNRWDDEIARRLGVPSREFPEPDPRIECFIKEPKDKETAQTDG